MGQPYSKYTTYLATHPPIQVACGMNLAVGDSARCRTGCLLRGDGVRFGAARCAGGALGMGFTGGASAGAVLGCGSDGCPNDGAEPDVELAEAAVWNGRDNVGVAEGARSRLGDWNLPLVGVGERVRWLGRPYSPLLVLGSVSGTPPRARWFSYDEAVGNPVQLIPWDELLDRHGVAGGQRCLDHVHGFRPGDESEDGPVLHIV